jgi:hypothetical protein
MLSEEQIRKAFHAHCVRPLGVPNPHGPLGLEQLAEAVARLTACNASPAQVERPVALPVETWQKLDTLAQSASRAQAHAITASELAAAILEQAVNGK